jgi:hypothetical protein
VEGITDLLTPLKRWGSVIGIGFDILAACLVWYGVRINIAKANALEEVALLHTFDDLGSPNNLARNEELSSARAAERVRASRWATIGLALFILGFLFQLLGDWPRNP